MACARLASTPYFAWYGPSTRRNAKYKRGYSSSHSQKEVDGEERQTFICTASATDQYLLWSLMCRRSPLRRSGIEILA